MVVFAPRYIWVVLAVFSLRLCLDRCVQAVRLFEKEFEQKVDHFDFSSRAGRTYKQRYLMTGTSGREHTMSMGVGMGIGMGMGMWMGMGMGMGMGMPLNH